MNSFSDVKKKKSVFKHHGPKTPGLLPMPSTNIQIVNILEFITTKIMQK